ncbi:hypothetical protein [uncultured Aliiroseovarius sp.]|uniref:OmpP1/FadL family transporter n=1 Tax=uncultured Aliiroseovarius sp. TaxID=1658783 RepID=UPI002638B92B|nr:hypothetical protein [uncultured Aliiroseovarius sp.]
MNKLTLTTAALFTAAATGAHAGIDRSNQDISILFEEGNYLSFSFGNVSPTIEGTGAGVFPISQSATDFSMFAMGYKAQLNDQISLALIWDQPYGADINYIDAPLAPGMAKVDSSALTGILRYEMGNGFSVHGGLRAQKVSGDIISSLGALSATSGTEWGGLVGVAYEKPEIALRVALTYFTAVDHELTGVRAVPGFIDPVTGSVEMPEAINLDFQTGIAENTLLFGSIRHAKWGGISLDTTGALGDATWVTFDEDVTSYKLGLGRRLNENWSVSASLGYVDGSDTGTTFLAPAGAATSIALGAKYTQGNFDISGGVQYTKFDTKTVTSGGLPVVYDDGDAVSFGVKMGLRF